MRCPFCYIGKRKFEMALDQFQHKDKVEIIWHSFELDPELETNTGIDALEYFSDEERIPKTQARETHQNVRKVAENVGLQFDLDHLIIANSFNAHRLIHFAKTLGLANEAEEELFKAYFISGKNIDDLETLIQTGVLIGMDEKKIRAIMESDAFAKEVRQDETRARNFGIRGVPFFFVNKRYGISGVQSPESFLKSLYEAWEEFEKEKVYILTEGETYYSDKCDN